MSSAGYVSMPDLTPNPKRMCRRGCMEYPDGSWSLCAWHEAKAQWAARETHRHDPATCPQCAALLDRAEQAESTVERLRVALADAENAIDKYSAIGSRVGGTSIDPDERPGVAAYAYDLSDRLAKVWLEWNDKRRAALDPATSEEGSR